MKTPGRRELYSLFPGIFFCHQADDLILFSCSSGVAYLRIAVRMEEISVSEKVMDAS